MKKVLILSGVALVFFLLGAAVVWEFKPIPQPIISASWIAITPREAGPILFDTAALRDDIPFPNWKKGTQPLSGHIKFLNRNTGIVIGYELAIQVDSNPVSALPLKYRKSVTLDNGMKVDPEDQVGYSGKFTFDLQDADGFSFTKVKTGDEHIGSGTVNQLKGMTTDVVPEDVVKRTKRVVVTFDAEKCDLL